MYVCREENTGQAASPFSFLSSTHSGTRNRNNVLRKFISRTSYCCSSLRREIVSKLQRVEAGVTLPLLAEELPRKCMIMGARRALMRRAAGGAKIRRELEIRGHVYVVVVVVSVVLVIGVYCTAMCVCVFWV